MTAGGMANGGVGHAHSRDPALSVIIPTYNRRERLQRVIERLAAQDCDEAFEVIVVSDGSTDGTEELLADGHDALDLRWAAQDNAGPAAARNLGATMARAEHLLFLDDDVLPDAGFIAAHRAAHLEHGPTAVVIGPMLDPDDHAMSPWVAWEQRQLYKQYRALEAGDYEPMFRQFYTGNASMTRDRLLDAGGFDPRFRRAEDVELGIRLFERGLRFRFEPRARGYHYAERSWESWRDIARAYGAMDLEMGRGPDRRWQLEFISSVYRMRHPALRILVRLALRSPGACDRAIAPARTLIERLHPTRLRPVAGWLLSAIYATDYWRAAAGAVGGRRRLFAIVDEYGPRTGRGGSTTPEWDAARAAMERTPKGTP